MRTAWEFTPGLPIWRLHPPVNKRIIGEVRDADARQTTFFALNVESGACLWRDRVFHDAWWVAIERVAGDTLVLHGFIAPDSPLLHGVTVVDIPGGDVVWSDKDWSGDESKLASAGIDLATGRADDDVLFPSALDPHGPELSQLPMASAWPLDAIVGWIEIAPRTRHTIAAAHIAAGSGPAQSLAQVLRIHDTASGKILYEDTLVAAAKGIAPDAFFVHDDTLYYIRERKTLCAVKV
jgi:hypothetical protein